MIKLKLINEDLQEICETIKHDPIKENDELWVGEKKYKVLKIQQLSHDGTYMTIIVKEIIMFPFMQKDNYQPQRFIYWEQ